MRRLLSFLWKAAVSAVLLYLATRLVDFGALRDRLSRVNLGWIAFGVVVLIFQIAVASLRWRQIADHVRAPLTFSNSLRYTLIGAFFNQALPSTVGGDASRIWLLARSAGSWRAATYSVLIDRAVGLIWLAVLVFVCLPWSLRLIANPVGRATLILIGSGAILGPATLFLIAWLGRSFFRRWRVTQHLVELAGELRTVLLRPGIGAAVGGLTIIVHLMTVLFVWAAARSIASPLEFVQSLLLIPPVILIAAVPISIGGWGVREGAMVTAFAYAGLPESDAFAISVLYGGCTFLVGLLGGLLWITTKEMPSAAEMARENGQ